MKSWKAFLQKVNPDIVHFHDVFDPRFVYVATREYPCVLTAHTVAPTCPSSARLTHRGQSCHYKSGWGCLIHNKTQGCLSFFKSDLHRAHAVAVFLQKKRALKRIQRVFAISQYVEDRLLENGWPEEKVIRVNNPVDLRVAQPLPSAPPGLLVYAARLTPLKGLEDLLQALHGLQETPWTLWVCGEGHDETKLKKLTVDLRLEDRVSFLGRLPAEKMPNVLASAAAVIAPNRGPEAFGLTVAEACAQGAPVITSEVAAINEWIQEGKTGYLFPPCDVAALREKIRQVLKHPAVARALAKRAQDFIQREYSVEQHLKQTLDAYQSARKLREISKRSLVGFAQS
jgi:glycosyltransferase involved in cell wall biosynthesis